MYERRGDEVWDVPLTHYDRSRNSLGLSREDFELMAKLADEHPAMREALEHAKALYLLIGHPRRKDDKHCWPKKVRDL